MVDYITGPGEVSKWESVEYGKIIYLFGENEHSNVNGCRQSEKRGEINMNGKRHMLMEKYLTKLFKTSPVFIDFYIEFGIMIDDLIPINKENTLQDMLELWKGCFGKLEKRNCPYNVRMHSIDSRRIKSSRYEHTSFSDMTNKLQMVIHTQNKDIPYFSF